MPALIRKFHDAKLNGVREVTVWGTGNPRREFLHVDDLADACVFLMQHYEEERHINVGTGEDLTIRQLAEMVRDIVYPDAVIRLDASKPDGAPAQAARCVTVALAWLAAHLRTRRRHPAHLRVVPRTSGRRATVIERGLGPDVAVTGTDESRGRSPLDAVPIGNERSIWKSGFGVTR